VIAGTEEARGGAFRDSMVELGVLGGLVLLLSLAAFLLRRKAREPEETDA
jgi:LPXTG-motif cell wall-anchored protein